MDILVTGGAGFLGSLLCERLLESHSVICLDNLYTGYEENVSHLRSYDNFSFIKSDVCAELDFHVDGIFNLACPASPIHYQNSPIETWKASTLGSLNVLELARKKGARVLQASTSEIYGDPLISPQTETYWGNVNTIGIRSCYDEGKRAAEALFMDYHRTYRVDIRIARIFNTYGPQMGKNDGRVMSNYIVQALSGSDLTVYGDGSQTRSFCYRDDLVEGLMRLFFTEDIDGPVNLGNPEPITMLDLAKEIIEATDSTSQITFRSLPEDDPLTREPDISKAHLLLGWSPIVARQIGIQRTIEYFRTELDSAFI